MITKNSSSRGFGTQFGLLASPMGLLTEGDHAHQGTCATALVARPKSVEQNKNSSFPLGQLQLDAFLGTLAPFLRASDNPMAIACFLLLTTPPFPPLPDRNVPRFLRRIALLTVLLAARPYLAMIASNLIKVLCTVTITTENLPRDRQLSVDLPPKTCTSPLAPGTNTSWLTRIYQDRCMLNPSRLLYKPKTV